MLKPCLHPGCSALGPRTRCRKHEAEFRAGHTGARGTSAVWRRQRKLALRRDRYRCVRCGLAGKLEVDHVDGNARNDDLGNLQTLCVNCHRDKHRDARGDPCLKIE
jgi:5-methylcytosine-specific restriction endonuclease McrA